MTFLPAAIDGFTGEHRVLDDLFGQFLVALESGNVDHTRIAIQEFDDFLRRHTEREEQQLFLPSAGRRLEPTQAESGNERLFRELRLEHVQVREVSGMILRLLTELRDMEGARRLAGNLARRWDAHTTREEAELKRLMSELT